ncbi:hypothetical protein EW145_g4456 [Phellinidium pouzarii]|uniref:F-box domain-containing protein n=1 Tax=Phellinidium pouzarii TaxID=167371 RepID=A0A4S4L3D7_9AGAM|nr:hypothetical protein EW145_g4456 [Phellinidium pouzarii]
MAMGERGQSAVSRCLELPEIVYEIATYLHEPLDLHSASCCNRLWYEVLLPLRALYAQITVDCVPSFLEFLKSNDRAIHFCQALRVLTLHLEDEDGDSKAEKVKDVINSGAISAIFNLFAEKGDLKFFMFALPGEPSQILPDDVWITLRKLSNTLQGLYIELMDEHWPIFLSKNDAYNPRDALIAFLHEHKQLNVLHLYLGERFAGTDFSELHFPELHSFLLISKAQGVEIGPFLSKHKTLQTLDIFTDSTIPAFSENDLPNLVALQVSSLTVPWFHNVLAVSASREQPIRHIQISTEKEIYYQVIQQIIAPLWNALRCIELIFWSRDVRLTSVLGNISETFPQLVELSLFIPSWRADDGNPSKSESFDMGSILKCFESNNYLLAISFSDSAADFLDEDDIREVSALIPPRLRYIVWRAQTFKLERSESGINPVRTYHPRNYRGSKYFRNWHEEMVFDHLKGDYDA